MKEKRTGKYEKAIIDYFGVESAEKRKNRSAVGNWRRSAFFSEGPTTFTHQRSLLKASTTQNNVRNECESIRNRKKKQ